MNTHRRTLSTRITAVGTMLLLAACGAAPTDGDAPEPSAAQSALEQVFTGNLSASGPSWTTHEIALSAPGTLDIGLDWSSAAADFNLFLYDASGTTLAYRNTTTAKPEQISFEIQTPGTYRIGIKCKSGSGSYTLSVDHKPAFVEYDFAGTTSATQGSWQVHEFPAKAGDPIEATLDWTNAAADLNLFLRDPSGTSVVSANTTTAKPEVVQGVATTTGTWAIGIKCKSGSTAYTAEVRVGGAAPGASPSYPGRAPIGTVLWGSSIQGNGDPVARHEAIAGHPLAVHRTFWQWSDRTTKLVNAAEDDIAHDRLPWVSVKTPSWAAMGAGQHDAEIDQMLQALDGVAGPVWLTVHHEPEGGGGTNAPDDPAGPSGHRAMNRRVRERMTSLAVDSVALAPVFMGYTWTTASGRNPDEWWEPGVYDFLGIDHYVKQEATLLNATWAEIRIWAADRDVDVAVGEWGMRGTDAASGQRVRDWFEAATDSHSDGGGARVVGLAAYDSNNGSVGGWELQGAQLTVFRELLGDPRNADVIP